MWSAVTVFSIPPSPNIAILMLSSRARRFAISDTYSFLPKNISGAAVKVEEVVGGHNAQVYARYLQLKSSAIIVFLIKNYVLLG